MKYALVFPGQGSQSLGMLSELSNKYPLVREIFSQASEVLGFDLWQLSQSDAVALNQTQNTQPAMLTAGFAVHQVLASQILLKPSYLAGHSLGEYTALVVGGYLDFPTAITLVQKRAQLMQSAVPEGSGAMAAILGLSDDFVIKLCADIDTGVVEAVNFNSPGQVVIAGESSAVLAACDTMKDNGAKRAVILPVSVPSHCSLMHNASSAFKPFIDKVNWQMGHTPIVHNVNAEVGLNITQIKDHLINQLSQSVRWSQTVEFMYNQGVQTLVECGNNKVLTGLTKRINKAMTGLAIFDNNSLDKVITEIK